MQPADLLQYARQQGVRNVQFGDNLPLHQLAGGEKAELKAVSQALRVCIDVGTRRLTKEQVLLYFPIALCFHSSFIRVVIDDAGYRPDEKTVTEEIERLLPHLQKNNVMLAIENHDRFPAKTLERIIRNTDQNLVGICLDTANSLGAGEGIGEVVSVLAPYTVNLHVKDIGIKRLPHKMGFTVEGCAAGDGMLHIPQIIDEVKKYNRCRTATLEVWSSPESTLEKTIAKEKQWVEKSIAYLKTILP